MFPGKSQYLEGYSKTNSSEQLINSINPINWFMTGNKLAKKKYDLIVCLEVLEHVDNVDKTLDKISKLMNPGGILVLSTINRNIKSLIFAKIFGEYVLNWIPVGTHQFEKFLKPEEIIELLKQKKIKIKKIKGMEFNPILNKWFLSNNTDINYFIVAKR